MAVVYSKTFTASWRGIGSSQPMWFYFEVNATPDVANRRCAVSANLYVKTDGYGRDPKINPNSYFSVTNSAGTQAAVKSYSDYHEARVYGDYVLMGSTGVGYIPYDDNGNASARFYCNLSAFNNQSGYTDQGFSCSVSGESFNLPSIEAANSVVYINGVAYVPYINGSKCDIYINGVKY